MKIIYLVLSVLMLMPRPTYPCSPIPGTEPYTMEEVLDEAPAVLIGTDIYHSIDMSLEDYYNLDWSIREELDNYAVLSVQCIMKSGGYAMGRNVTIYRGAIRESSLCEVTQLQVGVTYIIGLQLASPDPSWDQDRYRIYEPNPLSEGGFETTEENLKTAAKVFDLDVGRVGKFKFLPPCRNNRKKTWKKPCCGWHGDH